MRAWAETASETSNSLTSYNTDMQSWQTIEYLRWAGIVSLAVIVISGAIPVFRTVTRPGQSVSQTWSSDTRGHRLISIILTVFGAGLCAFMVGWLIPTYQLWPGMYAITLVGYLAILGVAWFPMTEGPGEHSFWHPHFIGGAVTACGAIIGYTAILLANADIPPFSYRLTLIALLCTAAWPLFFLREVRNYFIVLEVIVVMLFMAVIAALTFGR